MKTILNTIGKNAKFSIKGREPIVMMGRSCFHVMSISHREVRVPGTNGFAMFVNFIILFLFIPVIGGIIYLMVANRGSTSHTYKITIDDGRFMTVTDVDRRTMKHLDALSM